METELLVIKERYSPNRKLALVLLELLQPSSKVSCKLKNSHPLFPIGAAIILELVPEPIVRFSRGHPTSSHHFQQILEPKYDTCKAKSGALKGRLSIQGH
jgi:hypothetical protein